MLKMDKKNDFCVPEGKLRVILDTDTYNEVDDQIALAYLLLSQERFDVEAVYAAPFYNNRAESPGDGMEKSYQEILHIMRLMHDPREEMVFRGATSFLSSGLKPAPNPAVLDLVRRAKAEDPRELFVIAIGAPTNVATALELYPEIRDRITVIWLGGHGYWLEKPAIEFNMWSDVSASRALLDSGVKLVIIPAFGVTSHLLTTMADLETNLGGSGALCDFLIQRVKDFQIHRPSVDPKEKIVEMPIDPAWSKEIWDIGAVAYLIDQNWFRTKQISSPILTNEGDFAWDASRHSVFMATFLDRHRIYKDLYQKLAGH